MLDTGNLLVAGVQIWRQLSQSESEPTSTHVTAGLANLYKILKWQIDCFWKWANLRSIGHRDFQGVVPTPNGGVNLLFDRIIHKSSCK